MVSPAGSVCCVSWRIRPRIRADKDGLWWLGSRTLVFLRSRSCFHITYGLGGKNCRDFSRYSCTTIPEIPRTTHTVIMMKSGEAKHPFGCQSQELKQEKKAKSYSFIFTLLNTLKLNSVLREDGLLTFKAVFNACVVIVSWYYNNDSCIWENGTSYSPR